MRYNRNLSYSDAAWVQFRVIYSIINNFVYRRKWYARRSRGHINPHQVSDVYYNRLGRLEERAQIFYGYLCRTPKADAATISEEVSDFRVALDDLQHSNTDTDFAKFKSTYKKLDDALKIIEGHKV